MTRGLTVAVTNASPRPTLDPAPPGGDQTIKPGPSPVSDLLDAGRDVIYGGDGDDIIFGDHGLVIQDVADPNQPDARPQKIQTTTLDSVRQIVSRAFQNGGDDSIFGGTGRDTIIAGAGHDLADGDEQDDLLFGDNAFLVRRIGDTTSGRFQALCGTLLYSRTDLPNACGGAVGQDTSGVLLVNGVPQSFRDPDSGAGAGNIDTAPWWAEYLVAFDDDFADADQFHTFAVDRGTAGARSFGNDYLAGGANNDLLFGQMGDDVVQGDGGIESAFAGTSHVGASRTPDGCAGVAGVSLVCDYVGDLDIVPSFEAAGDGEDYIEGNGGRRRDLRRSRPGRPGRRQLGLLQPHPTRSPGPTART